MQKGYYIVGAVLLGVGAYLLYNKIRNGNLSFNPKSDYTEVPQDGSHLEPPLEVPPLATPPLV